MLISIMVSKFTVLHLTKILEIRRLVKKGGSCQAQVGLLASFKNGRWGGGAPYPLSYIILLYLKS